MMSVALCWPPTQQQLGYMMFKRDHFIHLKTNNNNTNAIWGGKQTCCIRSTGAPSNYLTSSHPLGFKVIFIRILQKFHKCATFHWKHNRHIVSSPGCSQWAFECDCRWLWLDSLFCLCPGSHIRHGCTPWPSTPPSSASTSSTAWCLCCRFCTSSGLHWFCEWSSNSCQEMYVATLSDIYVFMFYIYIYVFIPCHVTQSHQAYVFF